MPRRMSPVKMKPRWGLADQVSPPVGMKKPSCLGFAGSEKSTIRVPRPYQAIVIRFWSGACQNTWLVQPASAATWSGSFGWSTMLKMPALSVPPAPTSPRSLSL